VWHDAAVLISRMVDLSMPLDAATPFYPGDPEPRICAATTIANEGVNVMRLDLGSHSGTHCDAPFHFLRDGLKLDELPLERFMGPGVVVDCTGLAPRTPIGWGHLQPHVEHLAEGAIVLLHTGWDVHRESEEFFAHPFLDGAACRRLVAAGVRTVGIDAINIDQTPEGELDRDAFPCHEAISRAGGVIVENLVGLGAIDFADPWISVLPLHVPGADGAPARAVALQLAA
jgi:kynurenine formamidase